MQRLLVTFGNADKGRLGLGGGLTSAALIPRLVLPLAKFDLQAVAAGAEHTAVVTSGGQLLTFGSNERGQLGTMATKSASHVPVVVPLPEPVRDVSCGGAHTLVLTASGRVLAFGCNRYGQLGLSGAPHAAAATASASPQVVAALADGEVVSVAAGAKHSVAVTRRGEVLSWGAVPHGRLGQGLGLASSIHTAPNQDGVPCCWQPRAVRLPALPADDLVTGVAAGACASGAITQSGALLTWGSGRSWQLGIGPDEPQGTAAPPDDAWEPVLVPRMRKLKKLSLGNVHGIAVRTDERTVLWGADVAGCLGQGKAGGVLATPQLFRYWFTDASAGWAHSAGICGDGKLFTWGWGGALTQHQGLQLPDTASVLTTRFLTSDGHAAAHVPGGRRQWEDEAASAPNQDTNGYPPSAGFGREVRGGLRLGAGQLGVGSGVSLPKPTLVTRLEVEPGDVLRQDGGDPFSYQDNSLNWFFTQVACGANHTAALIAVSTAFIEGIRSTAAASQPRISVG